MTHTPLVLDVDGTLTREDGDGSIDPQVFDVLRNWDATIVIATGKMLAHTTALCRFIGIDENAISENGGVLYVDGELELLGDGESAKKVAEKYTEAGYELGWGENDTLNRWRETEVVVSRDSPLEPLREIAERHGLQVVDTGYAYHVKSHDVSKGKALEKASDILGIPLEEFVGVGDSENDVSVFEKVGESYAVANADQMALNAADNVTTKSHASGLLEVLDGLS